MQDFLRLTKALGDEARVRALMAVRTEELCLCQLIDLLGLAPSTVSKHMTVLHEAGLVQRRKQGRWHFYRLADGQGSPHVREALRWAIVALRDAPRIRADCRALEHVRAKNLEELSACYRS